MVPESDLQIGRRKRYPCTEVSEWKIETVKELREKTSSFCFCFVSQEGFSIRHLLRKRCNILLISKIFKRICRSTVVWKGVTVTYGFLLCRSNIVLKINKFLIRGPLEFVLIRPKVFTSFLVRDRIFPSLLYGIFMTKTFFFNCWISF